MLSRSVSRPFAFPDIMDTASLRGRLSDVVRLVHLPDSPLLLEPLVRCPEIFQAMASDIVCRDYLGQILASYQEAELKYRLLRVIQKGLNDYDSASAHRRLGKSLHDISGRFLWSQRKCGELFQMENSELQHYNLFELMDAESQSDIYEAYGAQLIDAENLRSVVISYFVRGIRLVSRCTPVYYSNGASNSRFGIFVETRRSGKSNMPKGRSFSPKSFESCEQPGTPSFLATEELYPTHLELKRTLCTPSPKWQSIKVEDSDCKNEVFTAFSITPLLSADEGAPEKDRRSLDIREFSALG